MHPPFFSEGFYWSPQCSSTHTGVSESEPTAMNLLTFKLPWLRFMYVRTQYLNVRQFPLKCDNFGVFGFLHLRLWEEVFPWCCIFYPYAAATQPHKHRPFYFTETPRVRHVWSPSGDPQTSLPGLNKAIKCDEGWNATKCCCNDQFSFVWLPQMWRFLSFQEHFYSTSAVQTQ